MLGHRQPRKGGPGKSNGCETARAFLFFPMNLDCSCSCSGSKLKLRIETRLPFTLFIHYMEHQERNAILDYFKVLEAYKDDEQIWSIIINMIRQEIGHE